jgi:hypothetical protein
LRVITSVSPIARPPRFGARSSLLTATVWLVTATVTAAVLAPPDWKLRVSMIGAVTLLPGVMAFFPSPAAAWAAAACWAVPGVLAFVLDGLGFVWLVAAALAFTGGVTESHRRRNSVPGVP